MRIERHPIGVWVREDGCVYLPQSGKHPAHWTFGNKRKDGYYHVRINGKYYLVHRLVAECYIPNPDNKPFIDHISRNPAQNNRENLRWSTPAENQRNTRANDRVDARCGVHFYDYEDKKQYWKEVHSEYSKTHKYVLFSDGKYRWVPNEQATELLKLPVKERTWPIGPDSWFSQGR